MKKLLFFLFLSVSVIYSQNIPVRGAWLTNVDSRVLNSKENIIEAVKTYKSLGLNTIFAVTWNKGFTLYRSKVMKDFTGMSIYPEFAGRDPLKELIEEAHKNNIKVIAWFEFGFSSSYSLEGGLLVKLKPNWSSKNSKGELVVKNGFDWINGFNPEVQDFMLSLIMEVVKNYDVDGIQGDDRLPAMPVEAGYDDYTVSLYKQQHNGANPPADMRDSAWIQWRADILNGFMKKIHDEVKSVNKNVIVSMAPSLY
ncbi:MAG: family 10 glycosylhydrolase, partial [Bacteroidota bacterium]|nr:family 10 glycosylhydrolase [Bacteroidota bacterium]